MVKGYKPQDFSFFHRGGKLVQQLVEDYLVSIIMMDKSAPVNKDYSYEEIIDETMLLDCFDYAHKEYLDGKCKSHSQVISEIKQEKGWK